MYQLWMFDLIRIVGFDKVTLETLKLWTSIPMPKGYRPWVGSIV